MSASNMYFFHQIRKIEKKMTMNHETKENSHLIGVCGNFGLRVAECAQFELREFGLGAQVSAG